MDMGYICPKFFDHFNISFSWFNFNSFQWFPHASYKENEKFTWPLGHWSAKRLTKNWPCRLCNVMHMLFISWNQLNWVLPIVNWKSIELGLWCSLGFKGHSYYPVFLVKQLPLSQPGGQIMPTTLLQRFVS